MAQEQEREGVHVLDVCVDYVGRDGVRDMKEVIKRYNAVLTKPIMLDSTEVPVIEAGAEAVQRQGDHQLDQPRRRPQDARPEDDPRQEVRGRPRRADHRREGPGRHRRVEVRGRQAHLRHRRQRVRHPAVATCCSTRSSSRSRTGQEQTRKSAIATFEAIRLIKQNLPGALTHLGLSNCSFGLEPVHPAGAQQRLPALRARVRPRLGDPARGQDHAAGVASTRRARNSAAGCCSTSARSTPPATASKTRCRCSSSTTPTRRPSRRRASRSATRSRNGCKQAIIQGRRETLIADLDAARERYSPHRHHQQDPARRHEGRRRPVRQRADAVAVRAAVGRGDEGRGRVPRTVHGEGRGGREGQDRPRHGEGRRPRHRQEPRGHHPDEQRLQGLQPRHQAADRRDDRRVPEAATPTPSA